MSERQSVHAADYPGRSKDRNKQNGQQRCVRKLGSFVNERSKDIYDLLVPCSKGSKVAFDKIIRLVFQPSQSSPNHQADANGQGPNKCCQAHIFTYSDP